MRKLNLWISRSLLTLALLLAAFGLYFGAFGWLNDGPIVGLRVFGVPAAFGASAAMGAWAFWFAADAHARSHPRRWWIQGLAFVAGYVAFGLAATASALLDRIGR